MEITRVSEQVRDYTVHVPNLQNKRKLTAGEVIMRAWDFEAAPAAKTHSMATSVVPQHQRLLMLTRSLPLCVAPNHMQVFERPGVHTVNSGIAFVGYVACVRC